MLRSTVYRGVGLAAALPLLLLPACSSIGTPLQTAPVETGQIDAGQIDAGSVDPGSAQVDPGRPDTVEIAIGEPCTLITVAELSELGFVSLQRVEAPGEVPVLCELDDGDNEYHQLAVVPFPPEENHRLFGIDPDQAPEGVTIETVTIGRHSALRYTERDSGGCLFMIRAEESVQVFVSPGSPSGDASCARTTAVAQAAEAKLP